MTENFKVLSDTEYDKIKDAIALITVYIAGADGEFHSGELKWAEKIASIRTYFAPRDLIIFYKEVDEDLHDRVENYIKDLNTLEVRNQTIKQKLAELNPIMAKLDPKIGASLYKSYLSFAKHVARASGGFLGYFSIGPEEKAVLDLKMIDPIIWGEEDDDTPLENK